LKFDIMMWTLNGERFLPYVLRRVEKVIPKECVHKRILVVDHSTDITVRITARPQAYRYPSSVLHC
jgi:glycosyltransferase involved in cell wall biosynthesis